MSKQDQNSFTPIFPLNEEQAILLMHSYYPNLEITLSQVNPTGFVFTIPKTLVYLSKDGQIHCEKATTIP